MKAVNAFAEDMIGIRTSRLYIDELFEELESVSPELAEAARGDAEKKAALLDMELTYGKPAFILDDALRKRLFDIDEIPAPKGLEEVLGMPADNCFLVAVEGDSMQNAGISDGDTLVCSAISRQSPGDIVIAELNNQILVKRYMVIKNQVYLFPENPLYKPRKITTKDKFTILGKVMKIIKTAD
ncbi:MAG: S24 family peptidase [bacterium]